MMESLRSKAVLQCWLVRNTTLIILCFGTILNAQPIFTEHLIADQNNNGEKIIGIDLNQDGYKDVLTCAFGGGIVWYENDGENNFNPHIITSGSVLSIYVIDLDQDNDLDIISGWLSPFILKWHENDGSQSFTSHSIATNGWGYRGVSAADIDGDGDIDVCAAEGGEERFSWYENNGSSTFIAVHTIYDIDTGGSYNAADIYPVDIYLDDSEYGDYNKICVIFFGWLKVYTHFNNVSKFHYYPAIKQDLELKKFFITTNWKDSE